MDLAPLRALLESDDPARLRQGLELVPLIAGGNDLLAEVAATRVAPSGTRSARELACSRSLWLAAGRLDHEAIVEFPHPLPLPAALPRCRRLERLRWAAHPDDDLGPLTQLPRLRALELMRGSQLHPAGLARITSLTQVDELSLTRSGLPAAQLRALARGRRALSLDADSLPGPELRALLQDPALAVLQLWEVRPPHLAQLAGARLDTLWLDGDFGRRALGSLLRSGLTLRALSLSTDRLCDDMAAQIAAHCPDLKELALDFYGLFEGGLSEEGVRQLAPLTHLRQLGLAGPMVDPHALAAIAELPQLEVVDASVTDLDDRGLLAFAPLPRLQRLFLTATQVTSDGCAAFRALHPEVELIGLAFDQPRP